MQNDWHFDFESPQPGFRPPTLRSVCLPSLERTRSCYNFYFAPVGGAKCCDQRVCVFVCLFACASQKPHIQISPNVLYVHFKGLGGLSLTAVRYVMYIRFCRWRQVFTYRDNGPNRPESETTHMLFYPVRQMATPGAKLAVFECILLT